MTQIERLQSTGIRRVGSPKRGFRYLRADGRPVPRQECERIQALKIPPAWTEVAISPSVKSKLQAVGKDGAGRWQYRYSEAFSRKQQEEKYRRIVGFARALPKIRHRVSQDLRLPGLGRDKVLACMLRILGTCFIRPGSHVYAEENGSFGLATLRAKHVMFEQGKVVGKYFESVDDLAKHEGPELHCSEKALLDMINSAGAIPRKGNAAPGPPSLG
jgi:DNA topoisomerase-1